MNLLQQLLLTNNYISIYQHAFEILNMYDTSDYTLRLCVAPGHYSGHNNLPTVDEVAEIVPGIDGCPMDCKDIILTLFLEHHEENDNDNSESNQPTPKLQCIYESHPAYTPLQYVLLFHMESLDGTVI